MEETDNPEGKPNSNVGKGSEFLFTTLQCFYTLYLYKKFTE